MTINPSDAAASLSDVAIIERRTREALAYARSSTNMMMWGALCVLGYLVQYFRADYARPGWLAIMAVGLATTFLITRRRARREIGADLGEQLIRAQLALFAYGFILLVVLWPVGIRQISAYWPTFIMMGQVLLGIWLGRFFIVTGLVVTLLTLIGYFWAGAWYPLWMAASVGGGLIASGLWLRRLGQW